MVSCSGMFPNQAFDWQEMADVEDSSRETEFLRDLAGAYRHAYASALAIVGNRADADDVIQEVCIVLWKKYDEFERGTDFRKWACSVAFHVARAFVRKHRKQSLSLSEQALARIEQIRGGGSELFELRREVLHDCLEKLSERDQQFLCDCYGSPISQVEFARSQGLSVETVYTRIKRIRTRLIDCVNRTLGRGP